MALVDAFSFSNLTEYLLVTAKKLNNNMKLNDGKKFKLKLSSTLPFILDGNFVNIIH